MRHNVFANDSKWAAPVSDGLGHLKGKIAMPQAGYVVVDIWRAKPGMVDEVDTLLGSMLEPFLAVDGVLSVDYTRLEETDDQYLVVFRYADQAARERFVATDDLKSTMAALRQIWDLESPVYRGTALF